MMKRVMSGVGANALDKLVIAAMQLAMVPVQVGFWGVHVYGLWVVLATVPAFLAFGDFGFAVAAGTIMTMQVARGERGAAARTFTTASIATLAIATAVVAIGVTTVTLLPTHIFSPAPGFDVGQMRLTIALLLTYGVACLQNTTSVAGFRAIGLFHVGILFHAGIYFSENVAVMTAIAAGASPVGAAASLLGTRLAGVAIQRAVLYRTAPWLRTERWWTSWAETKALLRPANAVMAMPAAHACLLQGSALALGASASAIAVPVFTTARTLSRVGLQMTAMFSTALMAEFSSASARGESAAQARILAFAMMTTAVLVVPFALVLALFGPTIIGIWTHGAIHTPAALMWVMAASVLFGGFWNPISNLLIALNWQSRYAYIFLGVSVLSIPLAYFLSERVGAIGAGAALMLVDAVMAVVIARLLTELPVTRAQVIGAFAGVPAQVNALRRRVLARG